MKVIGIAVLAFVVGTACGPGVHQQGDDTGDAGLEVCGAGCAPDQVCVADVGCRACAPGKNYCGGVDDQEVWYCDADGEGGTFVMECAPNEQCHNGFCLTACAAAEQDPSTVGCHFFAVDLDNSVDNFMGIMSDAAAQQFAVAVANVNDYAVGVSVYKNTAPFGQPVAEALVTQVMVAANDLAQIDLPQREVDGTMAQNGQYVPESGSGTFVSSHAYRIESTGPIVAYQFNPVIQQFSNDASLLIPHQALGQTYLVMGWPTSNPCGAPAGDQFHIAGIPDHTFVTIVGEEEGTHVTITPTHPVKASSGTSGLVIAQTARGGTIEVDIGPFDVVNIESDQPVVPIFECASHQDQDGDFSGTKVVSSKPVAVFSGNERGNGTGGANPPPPPGWEEGDTCCTDHLEEQMFPVAALGWNYAVSRSPVRSGDPSYEEPDIYRILGSVDGTVVNTSLDPPDDVFMIDAGQTVTFYSYGGFTAEATGGAIMLGQFLVSQELVPGGIGDPSFMVFPAVDQYRDHYVFLVPTTFQDNYMVVAMPESAAVVDLDGSGEFPPICDTRSIGAIGGAQYKQVTCRLDPGVHRLVTSEPAGLSVYGYYGVGSYDYCGGSDVDIINPIE